MQRRGLCFWRLRRERTRRVQGGRMGWQGSQSSCAGRDAGGRADPAGPAVPNRLSLPSSGLTLRGSRAPGDGGRHSGHLACPPNPSALEAICPSDPRGSRSMSPPQTFLSSLILETERLPIPRRRWGYSPARLRAVFHWPIYNL